MLGNNKLDVEIVPILVTNKVELSAVWIAFETDGTLVEENKEESDVIWLQQAE